MLSSETKRRIDAARDILVGKLPLPTDQVELITLALIYKFMDDLDEQSVQLGGKRSYFIKDLEPYRWRTLLSQKISGTDRVKLFADGLEALGDAKTAKHLPEMFRDIFRNAMLKFRDGQTLTLFLTQIDGFTYSHSEELGNAFEYLLQTMRIQGKNGQFRTPRHIIDFIVDILEPTPEDKILDPACGTGGFLVSAYKHILAKHTSKDSAVPGDQLTPAKREMIFKNIVGYDITPLMVKLSEVNLFLHGFSSPEIHEYDTLSNDARWSEKFDLILANPPFMTPTGGISPHSRFGITSRKAEVLFCDFFYEHLSPNGRAGFIVPEGITCATGAAYAKLRKMISEEALIGVISLPAGCFMPYSEVKTSIILLDKSLQPTPEKVFFLEVNNDGFEFGAQRKQIETNDLPRILKETKRLLEEAKTNKGFKSDRIESGSFVKRHQILQKKGHPLRLEDYISKKLGGEVDGKTRVKIGDILEKADSPRVGDKTLPIMSITMKEGLVDQSKKFKKRVASHDISKYKVIFKNELVVGFPIDEAVLGFQFKYPEAAVSPAYQVWKIKDEKFDQINIRFLENVLRSSSAIAIYKTKMQGSVKRRRTVPPDKFSEILIPLPRKQVQDEIAGISDENKKLEAQIEINHQQLDFRIKDIW